MLSPCDVCTDSIAVLLALQSDCMDQNKPLEHLDYVHATGDDGQKSLVLDVISLFGLQYFDGSAIKELLKFDNYYGRITSTVDVT